MLQQQLDDAAKEIEEMKAARRRQAEMVCVDKLSCCGCFASYATFTHHSVLRDGLLLQMSQLAWSLCLSVCLSVGVGHNCTDG